MSLFCQRHQVPSLPQDDKASAARQAQLDKAKGHYQWDMAKANLKGIPIVERVSRRHNFPSLPWVIKVFEVGLTTFENSLAETPKAHFKAKKPANCIWANLLNISLLLVKITLYPIRKIVVEWLSKHTSMHRKTQVAKHLRFLLAFLKAVFMPMFNPQATMVQYLSDLYSQFSDYLRSKPSGSQLQGFQGLFKTVALPETAKHLLDDDAFARFRLAGPNPMLLQGINTLPKKFPVTEAGYKTVMGKDSLAAALKEQRLYLLDFAELQALADHPGAKLENPSITTDVFAPMALFALSPDRKCFKSVAIQCYQSPNTLAIVYATRNSEDPRYWDWQTAKSLVQNADTNYHELIVHLARTHLIIEAFAIATPRYLSIKHPLSVLLTPHLEGTLFINHLAEKILVNKGGNVDDVFGADIAAVQAAAGQDRLKLNFYDAMLPNDLKRRKVDNPELLPDYPYRDDGLLVWNAIRNWVTAYLDIYYKDDAAVLVDVELVSWVDAVIKEGQVNGFTPITTKVQLTEVLTMVIYTASAQHAAVNFPQSSVMAYLPVFPGSVVGVKPLTGNTEQSWLEIFPPLKVAQAQLDLFYLLGSVYYSKIGEYRHNRFPYCSVMRDARVIMLGGPLEKFKGDLKQIEETILTRNQTREPYTFLLPSNIPASINI